MLSYVENIPNILEAAKPYRKILDAGPGMGKYGLLLKEQYASLAAEAGDMEPDTDSYDTFFVDCTEITPYFRNRLHGGNTYRNVFGHDIFATGKNIHKAVEEKYYDLVMLIDVVEHYPKQKVLDWLTTIPVDVLISTPKSVHMYTEHYYGDPNHHQSQWELSDFKVKKNYSTNLSHIVIV